MSLKSEWLVLATTVLVAAGSGSSQTRYPDELHAEGVAAHLERRLSEASALYDEALALESPRVATPRESTLARRFAPRLFTTATEPFALRDAVAIIHPTARTIAYHLFWADDIDFPDDNDPCDHEVVWIRHSPDGQRLEHIWTYFHGRLLMDGPRRNGTTRPIINVQWGKHGSLPENWRAQEIIPETTEVADGIPTATGPLPLPAYLGSSYRKLSTTGRRLPHSPLARRLGWPGRFEGSEGEFMTFSTPVDLLPLMAPSGSVIVSRFNSGTLNRWIIPYNFRPKTEWPGER